MSVDKSLYKCDECSLEITLISPAERPCPRCGGSFLKVHPLDYEIPRSKDEGIDSIVAEVFPAMLLEIEQMLASAAND